MPAQPPGATSAAALVGAHGATAFGTVIMGASIGVIGRDVGVDIAVLVGLPWLLWMILVVRGGIARWMALAASVAYPGFLGSAMASWMIQPPTSDHQPWFSIVVIGVMGWMLLGALATFHVARKVQRDPA